MIPDLNIIKKKLSTEEKFLILFKEALQQLSDFKKISILEDDEYVLAYIPFFLGFEELFIDKLIERMNYNKTDIFTIIMAQRVINDILSPDQSALNKEFTQIFINHLSLKSKIYYQDLKKMNMHVFGFSYTKN